MYKGFLGRRTRCRCLFPIWMKFSLLKIWINYRNRGMQYVFDFMSKNILFHELKIPYSSSLDKNTAKLFFRFCLKSPGTNMKSWFNDIMSLKNKLKLIKINTIKRKSSQHLLVLKEMLRRSWHFEVGVFEKLKKGFAVEFNSIYFAFFKIEIKSKTSSKIDRDTLY